MNINALLSPDEGAASPGGENSDRRAQDDSQSPSPKKTSSRARPALAGGKRTASGLSQEVRRSPDRAVASPTSNPASIQGTPSIPRQSFNVQPGSIAAPNFRPLPPTSVPAPESQGQYGIAQRPVAAHRPSSTPQMETLADLASMQQRQQTTRTYSANNVRGEAQRRQEQHSPLHTPLSTIHSPPIARGISRQSLADITMAEAPSQTPPPRDFTSNALSDTESKTVTDLLNFLTDNSYAYEQHAQLISLLHKGFLAHVYPPADSEEPAPPGNPHSYALLTEMRQAREAMDTRFAVGEDIWLDWLSDEVLLARTSEERITVLELFQKAVQDEPASVKLWTTYVDWVSANYAACNDLPGSDQQSWTDEDKEMCRELFTKDMMLNVLEQAVAATRWRIDESHHIWTRYAQAVQEEFPENPLETDVKRLHGLFVQRLQQPHAAWEDTMQLYWPIISKFEGSNWEAAIAQVHQMAEPAKIAMGLRAEYELKLQRTIESGDQEQVRHQFEKYLKSEKFSYNKKPRPFDYDLRCALYERALLRFPTATEWWLDYVDFTTTAPNAATQSLLPLIERATRHCSWSGQLWARRILRADVEQKSREEIENTKHRATNAGLLDVGGMEELVTMLQQWCSYLRRHAFQPTATEDDVDTAEVGITAALEDVYEAGRKIYGNDFKGDPLFRLEQIQIKFYTEARRINDAREIFRKLGSQHGNSYDYWAKYYNWELWFWGYDRLREARRVETPDNGPHLASEVCQQALRQKNLDWPEKALEMYLYHFQQHESGVRLQAALADARDFSNRLAAKRAKEAEEAAAVAAQQQEQYTAAMQAAEGVDVAAGEKRKREEEDSLVNGESHKKAKTAELQEPSASASDQIKRDREHLTITARNLPADVEEKDVKKFFSDCGDILSIYILRDESNTSAAATVEFSADEDVLAAKTRNGKQLNGREVRIHSGGQNTLYVTNYPASHDENGIRDLFKSYGEIISVRFPSLKFNSRRRFCYVQFLTPDMAKKAENAMDGKKLDGMHVLLAKISDPDAKKQRGGAQVEGREIIVKNIDREAKEEEVKELFAQYGRLEKVNLLRLVNNKLTGTGFFVYSSTDEASKAIEATNNTPFHDRILHVQLSDPKGRAAPTDRARREDVIVKKGGASASPEPSAPRGSDVEMKESGQGEQERLDAKERKVAILNLPDTVNDARIQTAMEHFGPVKKIQLRREKEGAIIEFENVNDAFKAKMGGDLSSLGPQARIGPVSTLMKIGTFSHEHKKLNGSGAAPSSGSALAFVPASTSRPGRGRGGRRGGLGFKARGGGFASASSHEAGQGEGSKKSNSDFRSMLEASKKPATKPADEDIYDA
ncbi:hypothetical protein M409DRAFT_52548 [Zasmidium cellare ATCC 36951]|uniref:U4/U6 snRNA-associated-splicing factor PRP24 n=1 Tax=Zasmidium cellare ATCC 36951 TaxID=1080233 RepID=A0A6A6CU20_ZASCE|nr:uncharacterized protein M409DRAFT_52548 [Zasmidium cellare ATCC 36951]KAF2169289.1 hypothetical protein M409DRAFT_52548 [Zasmidium cellare ATCC 36951]